MNMLKDNIESEIKEIKEALSFPYTHTHMYLNTVCTDGGIRKDVYGWNEIG